MNIEIIEAIKKKNRKLLTLLDNYEKADNFFPFHEAVEANNSSAIKILKDSKCSFNIDGFKSCPLSKLNINVKVTPLMLAISREDSNSFNKLIECGANVDSGIETNDLTPLQYAVIIGNNKFINKLMEKCALNKQYYLFHYAIEYGTSDTIKTINKKFNNKINELKPANLQYVTNSEQVSPLMLAIEKQDKWSIESLLLCKANSNSEMPNGFRPLQYAVHLGAIDIAIILINHGEKPLSFYEKLNLKINNKPIIDDIIENELLKNANKPIKYTFFDLIKNDIAKVDELKTKLQSSYDENIVKLIEREKERINECKDFNKSYFKKSIGNILTTPKSNILQEGRISFKGEQKSKYRPYNGDREKQILRHIATQIYFALEYYKADDLVEVQAMHLECNNNNNLFVAANKVDAPKSFEKFLNKETFNSLLTFKYNPNCKEGIARSKRYSFKLRKRVFGQDSIDGEDINDVNKAKKIKEVLRKMDIYFLHLEYEDKALSINSKQLLDKISSVRGKIFFIIIDKQPYSYKTRHAEEFLCDIADYLKNTTQVSHTCIAGKKRPCIGCYGRMSHNESILKFGKNPGLFWEGTIEHQNDAVAHNTIKAIIEKESFSSLSKDEQTEYTDYDSGSNSEEDDEKIQKFSI